MMTKQISSFGPHLKIIGISYYLKVLKEEKKKHKYTTQKTFMKTQNVHQKEHSYNIISVDMLILETHGNWMRPLNEDNKLQVDEKNNKN